MILLAAICLHQAALLRHWLRTCKLHFLGRSRRLVLPCSTQCLPCPTCRYLNPRATAGPHAALQVLSCILDGLADEAEGVRDAALSAGRIAVELYAGGKAAQRRAGPCSQSLRHAALPPRLPFVGDRASWRAAAPAGVIKGRGVSSQAACSPRGWLSTAAR